MSIGNKTLFAWADYDRYKGIFFIDLGSFVLLLFQTPFSHRFYCIAIAVMPWYIPCTDAHVNCFHLGVFCQIRLTMKWNSMTLTSNGSDIEPTNILVLLLGHVHIIKWHSITPFTCPWQWYIWRKKKTSKCKTFVFRRVQIGLYVKILQVLQNTQGRQLLLHWLLCDDWECLHVQEC